MLVTCECWPPLADKVYSLHDKDTRQPTLFGLQLFGQVSSPSFKARVDFTQAFKFRLLRRSPVHLLWMVERFHDIAADFAKASQL